MQPGLNFQCLSKLEHEVEAKPKRDRPDMLKPRDTRLSPGLCWSTLHTGFIADETIFLRNN